MALAPRPPPPDGFQGTWTEDPRSTERFDQDRSHLRERAAAVATPRDAGDVVLLVDWARRHRRPIVPRGGGSSLDGESLPVPGGVVVDLSQLGGLREVDRENRLARVGPGVVNFDLQQEVAPLGLFFPPNPGSWRFSTIGGNVATNASGPRSFRYGTTRAWVRGLEVVTGTGERLRVGSRVKRRSVGPDLLSLLVGSEGTLGIFTEVTVALAPRPARRTGLVVPLPDGARVGEAARRLARADGLGLSAVEYLDRECAAALSREDGARLPKDRALLLLEVEAADAEEEGRRLERLHALLSELGLGGAPEVYPDADRLWTLRGASGTALDREVGPRVREDVVVPLDRLDELLGAVERIGREGGVRTLVYGHLGDGSVHPNFVLDPSAPGAARLRAGLLEEAHRLGGSISSEHGIGRIKRPFLELELGAPAVDLLRGVKRIFDPDGVLNPGKLYP